MAEGRRFPNLVLPFALVGAAAGWLSAGLLANPLLGITYEEVKPLATLCTMAVAGLTGAVLTKLCVGRKAYSYEIEIPEEERRPGSDRTPFHVLAMLAAGALAGGIVTLLDIAPEGAPYGAASGFFCAFAFVPVGLAVLAAARRSKRARLGSIVAGSDRRAVWGILAAALGLATLLAVIDWPAAAMSDEVAAPKGALYMAHATVLVTLLVLAADVLALRRARAVVAPGLSPRENPDGPSGESEIPELDLGLGEDLLSRLARRGSAYRERDKTVALVRGNPDQALEALRRGIRRGVTSLALLGAVHVAHGLATTEPASALYLTVRCEQWPIPACPKPLAAWGQPVPVVKP
jgi:hypothetical protein